MEQGAMSNFCIDLDGMMLPDAIAAVVEAWYEAQNTELKADWVEQLRLKIKQEFGCGWAIRSIGATKINPDGRCQLIRIADDRKRTSVVLPFEWRESKAEFMYAWIHSICRYVMSENYSLKEAYMRHVQLEAVCNAI
jgi:hypothetical protein